MAELSDNVRWLVTNLIDKDQRIGVELQRRGEEYAAAGRPRDGSLQRDARLLVEDVVRQHNDMWPEASIGFSSEELDRAAGMVAKRVDEHAGFAWAESVEAEHEPAPRQTPQPSVSNEPAPAPGAAQAAPPVSAPAVPQNGQGGPAQAPPSSKPVIWPRVNFPNSYVHAYAMTARDGRVFDMMRVSIPQGTRVNGVDLTGWQLDRFASPRMREAKLNGRPVTVGFKPGEAVELWRGAGEQRETMRIDDPWQLCRAVKAQRLAYERERAENKTVEAKPEHAPRQNETVGPAVDSDGPTERARGRASTLDGIRQRASARTGSMQADATPMPRQTRNR